MTHAIAPAEPPTEPPEAPLLRAHAPHPRGADRPVLGRRRRHGQRHRPAARGRRRAALGSDGSRGRAVDEGDEVDGRQLQGVRLQQHDHGRDRGPAAPRPRRARVLRRDHPQAAAGSHAHPAHPGLLGRHADGGRRAERRRQGLLRDDQPRRRAGPDPGQRRRRGRPQGHRGHQGPARRAGLRRGSGGAHRRPARHRQRQPGADHLDHPRARSLACCWWSIARSAPR